MKSTSAFRKFAYTLITVSLTMGCHCGNRSSEGMYDSSYGLPPEMSEYGEPMEKTFVERHPLFASPKNYYHDSSDCFMVRVLAGTFVGIPVGIYREGAQIVYGQ